MGHKVLRTDRELFKQQYDGELPQLDFPAAGRLGQEPRRPPGFLSVEEGFPGRTGQKQRFFPTWGQTIQKPSRRELLRTGTKSMLTSLLTKLRLALRTSASKARYSTDTAQGKPFAASV